MAYFLRFTKHPLLDLQRGSSYRFSDLEKGSYSQDQDEEINYVANIFGCDSSDVIYIEDIKCYAQALGGLCGFELEAGNLEVAVEEAIKMNIRSYSAYIFEGEYVAPCPEGAAIFQKGKLIQKV